MRVGVGASGTAVRLLTRAVSLPRRGRRRFSHSHDSEVRRLRNTADVGHVVQGPGLRTTECSRSAVRGLSRQPAKGRGDPPPPPPPSKPRADASEAATDPGVQKWQRHLRDRRDEGVWKCHHSSVRSTVVDLPPSCGLKAGALCYAGAHAAHALPRGARGSNKRGNWTLVPPATPLINCRWPRIMRQLPTECRAVGTVPWPKLCARAPSAHPRQGLLSAEALQRRRSIGSPAPA